MVRPRLMLLTATLALLTSGSPRAQVDRLSVARGHVALGLALRQLATVGTLMQATAHPDDENNGLLAMLGLGQGIRTTLVTATRGDGGQNEIGPELSDALAVLRTEELLAAHRLDGAEQYFTRAVDFGYSFSIDETFQKWGRQEILGDYVRLIRTIRPDVVIGMRPEGAGGGQHHQASAVLAREAFRAAGDPSRFPEQLHEGLRPWQPKKMYFTGTFGFRGEPAPDPSVRMVSMDLSTYEPLLGRTYAEIGAEARSMHKCQGMTQLLPLPGPVVVRYRLVDSTIPGQMERAESSLFDGIDATIAGLAQYVGGPAPSELATGLAEIGRHVEAAQRQFVAEGAAGAGAPLVAGLAAVRELRRRLAALGVTADAVYEIDTRLAVKEQQFERAALLAYGVRIDALADDGVVIGGQAVRINIVVANRGRSAIDVRRVAIEGLQDETRACAGGAVKPSGTIACTTDARVPTGAALTAPYWKRLSNAARYEFEPAAPFGLPFRPTPFRATVELAVGRVGITVRRAIERRYEGDPFSGEKRMELQVVPAFSVRVSPDTVIVPATDVRVTAAGGHAGGSSGPGRGGSERTRELRVTVTNGARGGAAGEIAIELPRGWAAAPARAAVRFTREDESQTVRLAITPPAAAAEGEYRLRASVTSGGQTFDQGYQTIEYPHIRRRHVYHAAEASLRVIEIAAAPGLSVGYVMGVGDAVPAAIEQLGARVDELGADDLAWGDLSRYDVIVTGVRAYERRQDLRANNDRLLEYVESGGTLVVQYNRTEFNESQYGPYPVKVSSNRVTDESAPVQILVPDHPLFSFPNIIREEAWQGWVQERGLYFLGDRDPRYVDLVELEDPFEDNRGAKRGALVEARVGKGRWIYVGLGLWRQLPAGTPGAYQVLANLISLGKAPAAARTP